MPESANRDSARNAEALTPIVTGKRNSKRVSCLLRLEAVVPHRRGKELDTMSIQSSPTRKNAIVVGTLYIVASVAGVLAAFVFVGPVMNAPDYLASMAANAERVAAGALLEVVMAVAVAGIAIWLYPVLNKRGGALALSYVALRVLEAVTLLVFPFVLLLQLTVSQEMAGATASEAAMLGTMGTVLLSLNDWASLLGATIIFSTGALVLNYMLYRARLVPRFISIWGLIGAALYLAEGVAGLSGVIDMSVVETCSAPIAVNEIVLAVWLIVKGFNPAAFAEG